MEKKRPQYKRGTDQVWTNDIFSRGKVRRTKTAPGRVSSAENALASLVPKEASAFNWMELVTRSRS